MGSMKRIKYRLFTVLYGLVIIVINSTPGDKIPVIHIPNFDKYAHFAIYFGFGFLMLMAVIEHFKASGGIAILISFLIGAGFGALDEFHQYWVPRRIPSFFDFLADISGLTAGIFLMFMLILYKYVKVRL